MYFVSKIARQFFFFPPFGTCYGFAWIFSFFRTRQATAAAAAATEAATPGANPTSMDLDLPVDPNEPTYCFCNNVSYGEMVACDNPNVRNSSPLLSIFFFFVTQACSSDENSFVSAR